MILIEQRAGRDEGEGGEPPASPQESLRRREERACGEQCEDGVLSEVRRLADEEMNLQQRRFGDAGESHSSSGRMMREVFGAERFPVEAKKMRPIQTSSGP